MTDILCQVCGAHNDPELTFCRRCQQKLMVISGPFGIEEQEVFEDSGDDNFSLDEHLLERISILEEVVRRTGEGLRKALASLYKLEQKILVNQTGVTTLRDLLEEGGVLAREAWSELWESRMRSQLLALEKRELFQRVKGRILALYRGDDETTFRHRLDEVEQALLMFDIGEAVQILENAHQIDPSNHELAFFLAEIHFNEGKNQRAALFFEKVLAEAPDHFESLVYSGVLHHVEGRAQRAQQRLHQAVALYPDDFLPAFSLGALYAERGDLGKATTLLERALEAEEVPQAHLLLGRCAFEMGRVGRAIRHLEATLRQDPTSEEAHSLLGLACLERRWYRKARKILERGRRLTPFQLTYENWMDLLASGRLVGPLEDRDQEMLERAAAVRLRGRPRDTLSLFRSALAEGEERAPILLAYGAICLELGRGEEVESAVQRAHGLAKETAAAIRLLKIESLRGQGRLRESITEARLLAAEEPSPFLGALARLELAFSLAEGEDSLDEALEMAEQVIERAPEGLDGLAQGALGWVLTRRGDAAQGVQHLEQSAESFHSAHNLAHLGLSRLATEDFEGARTVFQRVWALEVERADPTREILATLQDGVRLLREPK